MTRVLVFICQCVKTYPAERPFLCLRLKASAERLVQQTHKRDYPTASQPCRVIHQIILLLALLSSSEGKRKPLKAFEEAEITLQPETLPLQLLPDQEPQWDGCKLNTERLEGKGRGGDRQEERGQTDTVQNAVGSPMCQNPTGGPAPLPPSFSVSSN